MFVTWSSLVIVGVLAVIAVIAGAATARHLTRRSFYAELTALANRSAELVTERGFVDAVIDSAGTLVVVLDEHDVVVRWNQACVDLTGYSVAEAVGRRLWSFVLPDDTVDEVRAVLDDLTVGTLSNRNENCWLTKAGERRRIAFTNSPIVVGPDRERFVVSTGVDVTEQRDAQQRVGRLLASSPGAVFETDREGRVVFVSDHWRQLTGTEPSAALGHGWTLCLHPSDKAIVLSEALRSVTQDAPFEQTYRIVRPDGEHRWILNRAVPIRDENAAVTGVIGVLIDQTDMVEANEEAAELAAVINSSPDFVIVYDRNDVVSRCSAAATTALGLRPGAHIRILDARSRHLYDTVIMPAVLSEGSWHGEVVVRLAGGDLPLSATFMAHRGHDGDINHFSVTAHDITELRGAQSRLAELAEVDQLTGLPNRRRLATDLASRLVTTQHTTAVLFIDLDGFKQINDTLGHEAGDDLLAAVADRLSALIRPIDVVCRLGGDEFVVLIDAAGRADSERIAQRVIDEMVQPFELAAGQAIISASVGVHHAQPNDTPASALSHADRAMYTAKHTGKNSFAYSRSSPRSDDDDDPTSTAPGRLRRDVAAALRARQAAFVANAIAFKSDRPSPHGPDELGALQASVDRAVAAARAAGVTIDDLVGNRVI